jgi:hypothetical protein
LVNLEPEQLRVEGQAARFCQQDGHKHAADGVDGRCCGKAIEWSGSEDPLEVGE